MLCVTSLVTTVTAAKIFGYDSGTAAGLMAGAFTESTVIGTAGQTIERLDLPAEEKQRQLNNIPVAYAVSYLVGTGFVVWFLSSLAPRLLKVDLKAESRKLEASMAGGKRPEVGRPVGVPRVGPARVPHRRRRGGGESERRGIRAVVRPRARVRGARSARAARLSTRRPATMLRPGDTVVIGARRDVMLRTARRVGAEVEDRELLDFPVVGDGRRADDQETSPISRSRSWPRCTAAA